MTAASTGSRRTTSSSCRRSASRWRCCSSSNAAAARSSTRPADRCSTSGRTSGATPRAATPRSSTARCGTRRRRRPRPRPSSTAATTSSSSTIAKTEAVCDYIRHGGDRAAFLDRFSKATSPGFDPDRDLQRIGLANQTTMLMSESLAIGEMFRKAMIERWGADQIWIALPGVRHDLQRDPGSAGRGRRAAAGPADRPDVVIGGYNSSNTAQPGPDVRRGPTRRSTSPIRTACCRLTKSVIARSGRKPRS